MSDTPLRRSGRTRNLPSVLSPTPPKACKRKKYPVKSVTSDIIKASLSETASIHNTLIVNGNVYKKFFGENLKPDQLVFVYYDEPKKWPDHDYIPTINGYTLQQINEGLCQEDLVEYPVGIKKHTFDKDHKNVDVVAVEYEGKKFKVKYAGLKPNGQPYFFTEHPLDALNDPEGGIRYYGEFLSAPGVNAAEAMNGFGKKRKAKGLHNELKYLLSLK
jgi:hypothetical protein